ncbi:MAG: septation protein SpoVG family protein [Eubacterium sp.]|nr:septation protein SpoVG family protein [Eubacterium sp.]
MYLTITCNPYTKEGDNIRGFANVVFNDTHVLENVRIYQGRYKEYVELPKYPVVKKDNSGNPILKEDGKPVYNYKDVFHPNNPAANKAFVDAILAEYKRVLEEGKDNQRSGRYEINGSFSIDKVYCNEYNREGIGGQLPTRGMATVHIGDFTLEKARIKEGQYGLFVDLPKYRTSKRDENGAPVVGTDGKPEYEYRDCFHAITQKAQAEMTDAILDAFNRMPVMQQENTAAVSNAPKVGANNAPDDVFDPLLFSPDFGQGQGR